MVRFMGLIGRLTVLLVTLASPACTRVWVRPGGTEAEFNRDSYECHRDSLSFPTYEQWQLYEMCVKARGWSKQ